MLGQYGKNKTKINSSHSTYNNEFHMAIDLNIDLQVYTKAKNQTNAKTNLQKKS